MSDELARLDATAQADLVRRGDVKPAELVEAAIERIERVDPKLNAVVTPLFEKARAEAESTVAGTFQGVPLLLKDLDSHSAGDPFHAGWTLLKELGWKEEFDTNLVVRFRQAGFVLVGKSATPEFGTQVTTESRAHGRTRNPWDTARSAGGSSGGAAAAVAAGLVPVAHASDGGGSIRIPASECGLVGLKPSRGRVSVGPETGEKWAGMVAELVVSRSVRDTAGVLEAVSGPMPGDPYAAPAPERPFTEEVGADPGRLRVGVLTHDPRGEVEVHSDAVAAAETVARLLDDLGHRVEESHPPSFAEPQLTEAATLVIASWTARNLDYWGERVGRPIAQDDVEPHNWALAEIGRATSASRYIGAVEALQAYTRRLAAWWEGGFDLLLTPTLPEPPPRLGEFDPTDEEPLRALARSTSLVLFTIPFNVTGQPALTLPLHRNDLGLPIGVQLVGAYGREDQLLRVAAQLEAARPWLDVLPPVHA